MRFNIFVDFCFCYILFVLLYLLLLFWLFVYTNKSSSVTPLKPKRRSIPAALSPPSSSSSASSSTSSLSLAAALKPASLLPSGLKSTMETATTTSTSTGSAAQSSTLSTTAVIATTTTAATSTAASPARLGATTPAGLAGSSSSTYAGGGGGGGGASGSGSTTAGSSCGLVSASASVVVPGNFTAAAAAASGNTCPATYPPTQTLISMESSLLKQDDLNNTSLASGISEGQRSLSGAPSASSSPILSPPGKIFGRNANGTMVATSRPGNEAEIQLYRVLQRASLLSYYDTLLEMGGDDVQQLYEAGEEEFLEIMALVGMATKPLHVRRLQKVLHEWANNPGLFQGPMVSTPTGLCETPTKSSIAFNTEFSANLFAPRIKTMHKFSPTPMYNPTPLINPAAQTLTNTPTAAAAASAAHLLTHGVCSPAITVPVIQPQTAALTTATLPLPSVAAAALAASALAAHQSSPSAAAAAGSTAHQVTSSSPQLTPVLTEMQVSRITHGAEKIANQLPQREPRAQTSKKRTSRELEQVIAMSEHDPRRLDEIRKYSAIYGRFDCKRRPEKPLTLHEVCVNEAAAQLCRLVPALLTRRDELFPLARQIVKDAGFGHSASIARYGGLLPQVSAMQASSAAGAASVSISASATAQTAMSSQRSSVLVDCESSDSTVSFKRQRLSPTEMKPAQMDLSREFNEDSRYNLFAMYQKFAKPPFDLSDIAKFSLGKPDFDDNDNDSRFSFSNSSNSPTSMPHNGNGESEMNIAEHFKFALAANNAQQQRDLENKAHSSGTSPIHSSNNRLTERAAPTLYMVDNNAAFAACSSSSGGGNTCYPHRAIMKGENRLIETTIENSPPVTPFGDVQVISAAAAGHIIAVANPALALSPTLGAEPNLALGMKREAETPDD